MNYKVCPTCKGYMFNPDQCDKCDYNREHGIFNAKTLLELTNSFQDVESITFNVQSLQQRLTDDEIQKICSNIEDLDQANKLFIELHHMNEVLVH